MKRGRKPMPIMYRLVWQRIKSLRESARRAARSCKRETARIKAEGRADALDQVIQLLPLLRSEVSDG